jgi:hypothetical protein
MFRFFGMAGMMCVVAALMVKIVPEYDKIN